MKKILHRLWVLSVLISALFVCGAWDLVDSYQWSDVDLKANPKTFNNLLGDKYDYRLLTHLYANLTANQTAIYGIYNGDDTSNYREYFMRGSGSSASASADNTAEYFTITKTGDDSGVYSGLSDLYIFGSSGNERVMANMSAMYYANTSYVDEYNASWMDTSDEITSLSIYGDTSVNTSGAMYLFRRLKSSQQGGWNLVKEQSVTARDMFNNPVVFNNLLGNSDVEYKIEGQLASATASAYNIKVLFNGDATATNYKFQMLQNNGGVLSAGVFDFFPVLISSDGTTKGSGAMYISPKSGQYRTTISKSYGPGGTDFQKFMADWWENSADEINTITLQSDQAYLMTGEFRLYKRSKNRSSYGKRLIYDDDFNGRLDGAFGGVYKNIKNDKLYEIELNYTGAGTTNLGLLCNSETAYSWQYLLGRGVSVSSAFSSTETSLYTGVTDANYTAKASFLFMPYNNGDYRPLLGRTAYAFGGGSWSIMSSAYWWQNTDDDIHTLVLQGSNSGSVTGNIKIYEIDLQ